MRLPHHLVRHPSGIFHYRQKIPLELQAVTGRKVIKKSLRTRCPKTAQAWAYVLAARYDAVFHAVRSGEMTKPTVADLLAHVDPADTRPYELALPNGVSIKATDAADHARAMEALKLLVAQPPLDVAPATPQPSKTPPGMKLAAAHRAWVQFIAPSTIRKTLSIKSSAVSLFVEHAGRAQPINGITRTDVAGWVQALRNAGLSTPTIVNKLSYLKGFFEWAKGAGHYISSDNPSTGQLTYSHREKRLRRKLGFKALTMEQVRALYEPKAFIGLSDAARWGALLGLYTGARVAEIGQLTLADFLTIDGVFCVRFTDDGEGQSLKNKASERTVPLHPDLIELGVMARVGELRERGETRFFPGVKVDGVNGMGNWLSKAFTRHLAACKVQPESGVGKVGFHSLRKTVIQAMQTANVSSEHRAQFVGHELDDEHHTVYSRQYTAAELLAVVGPALRWSLDLAAVRATLFELPAGRKPARKNAQSATQTRSTSKSP